MSIKQVIKYNIVMERFKLIPAVYLLLLDGDKILLSKRANTGYMDGYYGLVSGHVDGDEVATEALAREAQEEVAITVRPEDLLFAHLAHRLNRGIANQERMDMFFGCTKWTGEIVNNEPDKCAELSWHYLDALPNNIVPLVRFVIDAYKRNEVYSEHVQDPR